MESEEIKKDYEKILKELNSPELISDFKKFEELKKRKEILEEILKKGEELEKIETEIKENENILNAKEDRELTSLAEAEIKNLIEKKKNLEQQLIDLEKKGKINAIIIEIRAGVGGEEAALFAKDLFKMYSKYAAFKNWDQKILDSHPSELGGFKQIIFELKNGNVFENMQYEAGVHRVQRIPITEKSGRIHTSTSTVAILPKPKKSEIQISPKDLKIDFYRASGPGGQYVNKRMSAVRITHLPTGFVVTSQTERSQQQNKENALVILEARLLEREKLKQIKQISGKRKAQIGFAKRAEKIRTYNFPQARATDHRIKKSWHNLDEIMEGKLETIIKTLKEKLPSF